MTSEQLQTAAYDEYERGILALHQMSLDGTDGSAEADRLRDQMLAPWAALTPDQRAFGDGVSGDLFMLEPAEGEIYVPVPDEERSPQRLGLEIATAENQRDWSGLLDLLRRGPAFLTVGQVAFLRARAYQGLGRLSVALAFVRFARGVDPENVETQELEFELLAQSGQADAILKLAYDWVGRRRPAKLAIMAAGILFRATQDRDEEAARELTMELVDAVRAVIGSGELPHDRPDQAALLGYAHLLLGACLDRLGSADEARAEYDLVLAALPRDPGGFAFHAALREYVAQRFGHSGPTAATADQRSVLFAMTRAFGPPAAA